MGGPPFCALFLRFPLQETCKSGDPAFMKTRLTHQARVCWPSQNLAPGHPLSQRQRVVLSREPGHFGPATAWRFCFKDDDWRGPGRRNRGPHQFSDDRIPCCGLDVGSTCVSGMAGPCRFAANLWLCRFGVCFRGGLVVCFLAVLLFLPQRYAEIPS